MVSTAAGGRVGTVARRTNETEIELTLNLDGPGSLNGSSGVGFFDHMLTHIAHHGNLQLALNVSGDLHVDDHHTVEDIGICLGQTIRSALGDSRGIQRYGSATVPMDEALVLCAIDLSGRGFCVCDLSIPVERLGTFTTELVPEFYRAVAHNAGMTLHLRQMAGANGHHIVEAAFKAFGRALKQAISLTGNLQEVPSTKGVL